MDLDEDGNFDVWKIWATFLSNFHFSIVSSLDVFIVFRHLAPTSHLSYFLYAYFWTIWVSLCIKSHATPQGSMLRNIWRPTRCSEQFLAYCQVLNLSTIFTAFIQNIRWLSPCFSIELHVRCFNTILQRRIPWNHNIQESNTL